jgi:hypothetical protein
MPKIRPDIRQSPSNAQRQNLIPYNGLSHYVTDVVHLEKGLTAVIQVTSKFNHKHTLVDSYTQSFLICYLRRSWLFTQDQVLAKIYTYSEVFITCINLGLQTLMIIHQQLHTRHIPA